MHEYILAGGALDESVSLRPVEPLHSTLLSHKETPFVWSKNYSSVSFLFALLYRTSDTRHFLEATVRISLASPRASNDTPTETAPLHFVEQLSATKCREAAKTKARYPTADTETSILLLTATHSPTVSD
jgi:hypothetical protein